VLRKHGEVLLAEKPREGMNHNDLAHFYFKRNLHWSAKLSPLETPRQILIFWLGALLRHSLQKKFCSPLRHEVFRARLKNRPKQTETH